MDFKLKSSTTNIGKTKQYKSPLTNQINYEKQNYKENYNEESTAIISLGIQCMPKL